MVSGERRTDVFIVAAEPSGDQLGAGLAAALNDQSPHITIKAIGGPQLSASGFKTQMDIDGLAILGFVEGLRAYRHVLKKVKQAIEIIDKDNPKCVVLIDSWGFMVRVAKGLKARGYQGQIIKFVAPQVWAMRAGRARILARHVDHLLSIWPMDKPYFDAVGLPQTFVGNPVFDTDYRAIERASAREQLGLDPDQLVIGLFVGSRPSEISNVAPAILRANRDLALLTKGHVSLCVVADPVADSLRVLIDDEPISVVAQSDFLTALACLDGAIACSGTVTTQLAAAGVPTIVMYRLSPITFYAMRRLFKPNYISMVNIGADQALMPEFIQDDIDNQGPHGPAAALWGILSNPLLKLKRSNQLMAQTKLMSGDMLLPASAQAARAVLSLIKS